MANGSLSGLRVLVVEDQMIIALEVVRFLESYGSVPVGPVGRLDEALHLALHEKLDAAVLDVNLDGEMIGPVVEALQKRSVPTILATGYGATSMPPALSSLPAIEKPVLREELENLLTACLGKATLFRS